MEKSKIQIAIEDIHEKIEDFMHSSAGTWEDIKHVNGLIQKLADYKVISLDILANKFTK